MAVVVPHSISPSTVCPTVYSMKHEGKHQWSASLVILNRIHWWPDDSPHKRSVTRKALPCDDVIVYILRFLKRQISTLSDIRGSIVSRGLGSPLHAWLATINLIIWVRHRIHAILMKPDADVCTITFLCIYTGKTISLIPLWFKLLMVDIIKMRVAKFGEKITNWCWAIKA